MAKQKRGGLVNLHEIMTKYTNLGGGGGGGVNKDIIRLID